MNLIHDVLKKFIPEDCTIIFAPVPDPALGDVAFPCFELAKKLKKNPVEVALDLANKIQKQGLVEDVKAVGPYVNFSLHLPSVSELILKRIWSDKLNYGKGTPRSETVVVDLSAPNIAKPFGIGHLRSTVIGNSLCKIYRHLGSRVIGVNHIGDWGTQFGKLIVAYKKWSDRSIEEHDVKSLYKLYTKFHEEAEKDGSLNECARMWFKKLEDGNAEAFELWSAFRELSLKEFDKTYELMGITFEETKGEAYYEDYLAPTIEKFKPIAVESEGALVVELDGMIPLMLRKSDGATLYATRDLAAAIYRLETHKADKLVYVVGEPQKLHFKQLFATLRKGGYDREFIHADFGHIRFPEGKMSTRKGNIIFLEEVLDKAIELARATIEEKNPKLENKKEVAKEVGVGAIVFSDLQNDRVRNIIFSWENALDFEGESGPYLQYTHARACSILRRADRKLTSDVSFESFQHGSERKLVMRLTEFQDCLLDAERQHKPHILCRYLLDLAQDFNEFYHACPVISDVVQMEKARLLLVDSVRNVLEIGLSLLGMKAPKEM